MQKRRRHGEAHRSERGGARCPSVCCRLDTVYRINPNVPDESSWLLAAGPALSAASFPMAIAFRSLLQSQDGHNR